MLSNLLSDLIGSDNVGQVSSATITLDRLLSALNAKTDYAALQNIDIEDNKLSTAVSALFSGNAYGSADEPSSTAEIIKQIKERINAEDLPEVDAFTLQMLGLRKE